MPVLKKRVQLKNVFVDTDNVTSFDDSPKTKRCSVRDNKSRCRRASLTVEAALVFPVFFFSVYMLWQLFLLLLFQMNICHGMTKTAMEYAHLGYPARKSEEQDVDISLLYQPLLWNALPESERAEGIWVDCRSEEDGTLQVKVYYRFACETVFFTKFTIPVEQNFRFYPYLGKTERDVFAEGETEPKDIVYMTEYGSVYHESRACSYLNVVVRPVAATGIDKERNSSGRRYTLCERCDDRPATTTVYISSGGEKYHLAAACPALKRTVQEKERKEVEHIPACHKCGKKSEEE